MGTVYKVVDEETKTIFALKLLHRPLSEDAAALKRFEQEAAAAAKLNHPNLVPVYSHGTTESGCPYLLMDYVDGESLADIIEREGSLLERRAINIFTQICEALSHAHEHDIIHRDIKPSNILISRALNGEDEVVRVVDFGIAKTIASDKRETCDLTKTGEVFGSPQYMSPEQCLGFLLDQRSDIYSLGCLMYETLSGRPPFVDANAIQLVINHMNSEPTGFTRLDSSSTMKALEAIALSCLEKQQIDRPQAVTEILKALTSVKTEKHPQTNYIVQVKTSSLKKSGRFALVAMALIMPLATSIALFSVDSKSDTLMIALAQVLTIFSAFCAGFALFLKAALRAKMERESAWTINSLLFCSLGFLSLIPLVIAPAFTLEHRFDIEKANIQATFVEPTIILGFLFSTVCSVVALVSAGQGLFDKKRKDRFSNLGLMVWSSLATSLAVVVVLLSCPIVGDYIFIPAVLRRTSDLPIGFGTALRKTLLENLVSRTPVDKPYLRACLNGYRDIKDYQKVIELTTLSIRKTDPKDKDDLSCLFYRQGDAYERLNKFEEAIASYSRDSDLDPDEIWTLLRRADCFVKVGRPFAALSDLRRVHVLNPLESTAYYLEIKILLSLNKVQSALDCVDRRIALQNGRTPYSLLLRSTLLEKLGRNAEAKKDLLQVGQLDGEYDKFVRKLLRAVVYERLGDTKNSRKCLASITPADRIDDLQYLYDVDDFTDEIKSMMQRLLPNDETLRRLHLDVKQTDRKERSAE